MGTNTDNVAADQNVPPVTGARWLPTSDGALRRDCVTSFAVERVDGDFKGGYNCLWTIHVRTTANTEPVRLRVLFFEADELCAWVDRVFPGSSFALLPPPVVAEAPQPDGGQCAEPAARLDSGAFYVSGKNIAETIRGIGDAMYGGDTYTPPQNYRPPPGAAPIAI